MKKILFFLVVMSFASSAWAVTKYSYTGNTYTGFLNYTPTCSAGSCANFSSAMGVSGFFTTASPLPPNLVAVDITAQVSSFSFSDGLTTYSSTDPKVVVYPVFPFVVNTDGSGQITGLSLLIERWQTGTPHVVGDRIDYVQFDYPTVNTAGHNNECSVVVSNYCDNVVNDSNRSGAQDSSGSWTVTTVNHPIPTLSQWGLLVLSLLLGTGSVVWMHRRNQL